MRTYFRSLPEDHRRRYAAIEAQKIGLGGVAYISQVLGISRQRIYTGMQELQEMGKEDRDQPPRPSGHKGRIRRRGVGRRKDIECKAGLEAGAENILQAHSAGSPTDENVRWRDLEPLRLAQELTHYGYVMCSNTAAKLLDWAGYRRRFLRKELIIGHVDAHECDQQFRHLASGTLAPHRVYDFFANVGFMTFGTSRESSAFVCDAIALAWELEFSRCYRDAPEILLSFDADGANSIRSLRFKEALIGLSKRLWLPLRIAHYPPPYTYKWHPIEHSLFYQVERALHGVILDSPQSPLEALQRTCTTTGLRVTARVPDRVYTLGRKCSDMFKHIKNQIHSP
jgi:hypothetical protein